MLLLTVALPGLVSLVTSGLVEPGNSNTLAAIVLVVLCETPALKFLNGRIGDPLDPLVSALAGVLIVIDNAVPIIIKRIRLEQD